MREISANEVQQVSGGVAEFLLFLAVMAILTALGGEVLEGKDNAATQEPQEPTTGISIMTW